MSGVIISRMVMNWKVQHSGQPYC